MQHSFFFVFCQRGIKLEFRLLSMKAQIQCGFSLNKLQINVALFVFCTFARLLSDSKQRRQDKS